MPVREYETVFILHPKVDEGGIEREIGAVTQTIEGAKGEMIGVHKWGRKKLAYPIQKANEGFYVLLRFNSEQPELLKDLDRHFKLNEQVLRHLTVISPGGDWPPELRGRERRAPRGERFGGPPRGGRREPREEERAEEKTAPPAPEAEAKPEPAAEPEKPEAQATGESQDES